MIGNRPPHENVLALATMKEQVNSKLKGFSALFLAIVFLLGFSGLAVGQTPGTFDIDTSPLPKPVSPVMDYAGVIDEPTEKRIEQKILDFSESSNPRVALVVAVIDTTDGIEIADYSLAVARGWGIGFKADDDPGALLLVAVNDRKYFTQVGYDLEDELPDGLVGSLQRRYLVPEFKKGNYGKGIEDTIDAYIQTIEAKQAGVASPLEEDETDSGGFESGGPDLGDIICCLAGIIGFVIFIIWSVQNANRNGGGGGSGKRRRDETTASDVLIDIAGGLVIGALTGGSSGGGSSSSWGGSSGGGDWGGFGGGGSFGGGGAGGSW